ncbi:MAG: hypothetical protein IJL85_01560 [Erysipelotrichaceae bacterium]|nr:hypothetical protein [Erysipelotrichaceae bacterium]
MMENNYYGWFNKLIGILTDLFFMFIPAVTLYVFTSTFEGYLRYVIYAVLILFYLAVIHFGKDRIRSVLGSLLDRLKKYDEKTLLLIVAALMIIFRILYTVLFDFDATTGGDTQLYDQIADQIIASGTLRSKAISHLFAVALHFVPFKLLHIPIRHGMFLPFFLGTLINFLSFTDIVGKEKSFLLFAIYLLMPSSILYSFCPTHEVFLYFYLSAFLYFINQLLKCKDTGKTILLAAVCTLFTILAVFVNPVGYIIYVILLLIAVLSRTIPQKKIAVIAILVLALLGSRFLDRYLEVNSYKTATNTYTILIHGSNPYALGEQVDGYPHEQTCLYLAEEGLEYNNENYLTGMKAVLLGQYRYLLTHPVTLLRLIVHKFYLLWSGDHYPIEMAHVYGQMSDIVYYLLLILSAVIYLFMATVHNVYKATKEDTMAVQNYRLALLGIFAVTMLSIVLNKYGVYATPFIYLISMKKAELEK